MAAAFILYSTDIHKSKNGNSVVGVYTTQKCLLKQIRVMLKNTDAVLQEGFLKKDLPNFSIMDLHNRIDYIAIDHITLNQPI